MTKHFTDSTYLRTIHDGLLSGIIHKDNASTLPIGLIGIYEEALPPASNVNERKKFLEFFAVWALLKKEVSAAFVVPLLEGWTEEKVLDYISRYSKWFNSPVSGKYVLYHERLKAYILEKLTDSKIHILHEQLINRLEIAINEQKEDEFEWYGLEFLCVHLKVEGFTNENNSFTEKLFEYSTSSIFWSRQKELLGSYRYTRIALKNALMLFEKIDHTRGLHIHKKYIELSEIQRAYSDFILLNYQSISIERILISIEDYHNCLLDEEDKFLLFITIFIKRIKENSELNLDSKQKLCASILKYVSGELNVASIAWNELIPEKNMLDLCVFLSSIELDFAFIFDMIKEIKLPSSLNEEWIPILSKINNVTILPKVKLALLEDKWIKKNDSDYSDEVNEFLITVRLNDNSVHRSQFHLEFIRKFGTTQLFEQQLLDEVLQNILKIENSSIRNEHLVNLIEILLTNNNFMHVDLVIDQIASAYWKCLAFQKYYSYKSLNDNTSVEFLLSLAESITNESVRNESIKEIVSRFGKFQFEYLKSVAIQRITSHYWKSMAFLELSKNDTTSNCILQAIEEADLIPRDSVKSEAFMEIALHFFRTDNIQSGLDLIEKTPSFYWKSYVLCELIRLEKEINQEEIIYQLKDIILKIENENVRSEAYYNLISATFHSNNFEYYINIFELIASQKFQKMILREVSETLVDRELLLSISMLYLNGFQRQFSQVQKDKILRSIIELPEFNSTWSNVRILMKFSSGKNRILHSLNYLKQKGISDIVYFLQIENDIINLNNNSERSECYFALCKCYIEDSMIDRIINIAASIPSSYWRTLTYINALESKLTEQTLLINLIEDSFLKLENQGFKDEIGYHYYNALMRNGINKAEDAFNQLQSRYWKVRCLLSLSEYNIENNNEYKSAIHSAIEIAQQIDQSLIRSEAMVEIGLFCLKNLKLIEYELIWESEIIKNHRERLVFAYALQHFDVQSDSQLIDYLTFLETPKLRQEFISQLIIESLKSKRENLLNSCLNQLASRKEHINVFGGIINFLIENNSLVIPVVFERYIHEIMVAISSEFDLNKLNLNQKLYYLRHSIQDETVHSHLYHQLLLKDYFIDRNEVRNNDFKIKESVFDIQWAIDIKNSISVN